MPEREYIYATSKFPPDTLPAPNFVAVERLRQPDAHAPASRHASSRHGHTRATDGYTSPRHSHAATDRDTDS